MFNVNERFTEKNISRFIIEIILNLQDIFNENVPISVASCRNGSSRGILSPVRSSQTSYCLPLATCDNPYSAQFSRLRYRFDKDSSSCFL